MLDCSNLMYETIDYQNGYHVNGAIHLLREPLDCDQIGLTVAKCGPSWTKMEHDYAADPRGGVPSP